MTTKTHQLGGFLALAAVSLASSAFAQEPAGSTSPASSAGSPEGTAEGVAAVDAPGTVNAGEQAAPQAVEPKVSSEPSVTVASAESRPAKGAKDKEEATLPDWELSPKIKMGGYVHSAFIMSDGVGKVESEFRVRKARLQLNWSQGRLLGGSVEVEMANEIGTSDEASGSDESSPTWAPLRDAYVEVTPLKAVGLRIGQFKRPFSRLALTSSRKLKLVSRGISDAWLNGELAYGDRDVGAELQGEFGKNWGLDYAVGLFNGTGSNAREIDARGAKDIVGRVVGHLGKHVEIGANVSSKSWDDPPATISYKTNALAFGGDVEVDFKGLYGMLESGYADYYTDRDATGATDKSLYFVGIMSYKIDLTNTWKLAVEPLVKGELLVPRTSNGNSKVMAGTAGANLHVGDVFRLMVQGDLIAPNDESLLPEGLGEADTLKRLTIQVALHTK